MSDRSLADKIQGKSVEIQMVYIAEEMDRMSGVINEINDKIGKEYMTVAAFKTYSEVQKAKEEAQDRRIGLLERIIFGLIALIVVAVIGALINLVVK